MDKTVRNAIERATQQARKLLDEDFSSQLEGTFDVLRNGVIAATGGTHLSALQQSQRRKIVAAIEHKRASGMNAVDSVTDYVRDAAFTTLNRFVALKMLEARELVQECITKGEQSAGYREFCGMAPGIALLPDAAGYRLYIECLFDEFSTEIKVLFDRRDTASVLWPKRQTFETLLAILNTQDLSKVWGDDETIGWVYQFFNSGEERRQMRDQSHAPRNGRELAVRNQFFTPRYVVQFLTDNTLGRLWLQMYGEETQLSAMCDYLVRAVDEPSRVRQRKDPRDLRILDPACGSGHFLLYCFDLLLVIYEEAWALEEGAPRSDVTGQTLRVDFPDFTTLRHAVPKLIVEQNLYGVDIDPRCAQIAALALWLRAQRAWKELGVPPSERHINRTHIVVAEPMPGDASLVEEFAARLDPPLLRDLFRQMVAQSRLAGELGMLLRIEDGIAAELATARELFIKQRQTPGFLPGMETVPIQSALDFSGIDDDGFFHEAEIQILEALRRFAETAVGSASVRRRLFAGDATQGVALIDLARTRFDVVLMNPPFGSGSLAAKKEFEKSYPRTKNDVFASFVERGIQLLHPMGLLGAITSRAGFFLSSFQTWREEILLRDAPPVVFADLGYGVLDSAMVEVAAYCLERVPLGDTSVTVFINLKDIEEKGESLRALTTKQDARRFVISPTRFQCIPTSPFAYWITPAVEDIFRRCPAFLSDQREARQGASSTSAFRYLRLWTEPAVTSIASQFLEAKCGQAVWVPFAKGGAYSRFHSDLHLVMNWARDGREVKEEIASWRAAKGWGYAWSATLNGYVNYGRPGLTWTSRTQGGFSMRALNEGCIFADKGPAAFVANDDEDELLALLALTNSTVFSRLLALQMSFGSYEVGVIQRTPVPAASEHGAPLSSLALDAWRLKRSLDSSVETSHAFTLPALMQVSEEGLEARTAAWSARVRSVQGRIATIQSRIDECCLALYGLSEHDLDAMGNGCGNGGSTKDLDGDTDEAGEQGDIVSNENIDTDAVSLVAGLRSWALGVAFGRFDARLATGERICADEPRPFEPLHPQSPAMWPLDEERHVIPPLILVDDPGHADDLVVHIAPFIAHIDSTTSDDLRKWYANEFFPLHIKMYSMSRRKAPMYWQLATPSASYSVWLYLHAFTMDTLYKLQNDYVAPKLAHEESRLESLRQELGESPRSVERKALSARVAFVDELRAFLEEVKRTAPLWNPAFNDGAMLAMSPLWRLVPHNRSWQKELKATWEALCLGEYDWAHLAMHLWPERVIPKCATDRSLAIAHGLEDVFWVLGEYGKWEARPFPTRSIEELVHERTSTAVKAALKSLLEAPTANSNGGRRRGGRTSPRTANGGIS